MVLDTRKLKKSAGVSAESEAPESGASGEAGASAPPATDELKLEALIEQASNAEHMRDRAEAVASLRTLVPGSSGIDLLCGIVESEGDSRRLIAAQMLGYHRQWLSGHASVERVARWAHAERDPEVGAALVWILRGRDAVQSFLLHGMIGMAREAALGLPVKANTLPEMIRALFVGRSPDVDRILLEKLSVINPELVTQVIDLVLEQETGFEEEVLAPLFACLPQPPLFDLFIAGHRTPEWDTSQGEKQTAAVKKWHQVARFAEQTLRRSPDADLIRYLVSHSARDDTFARRHASFLRAAMANTEAVFGSELIDDIERLTVGVSEERLLRMAEILMDLAAKLEEKSGTQAAALLREWKRKSPDLKLKIYHLEQGL